MRVGIVLAAGLSSRFGASNKLMASVGGTTVLQHALAALSRVQLDRRMVVASSELSELLGPEVDRILNSKPDLGLGYSVSIAARAALEVGASRLLILLGDMPFVSGEHCNQVIETCTVEHASASVLGGVRMPPACFPRSAIEQLATASGEVGAKQFIAALPPSQLVEGNARLLMDIDTVEDLAAAQS